jgi:aryl-alcohol dehydrogenase-like predicted oxidoreductase
MTMTASPSGTFKIGGELEVNRLGFGAMRIVGAGVWGPPPDRAAALQVLRRLPALDVNLIDTADSYGPYISEELICEELHPYDGLVVATKAGLVRHGPGDWKPLGRPEHLRASALMSLRRLRTDRLDLFQLHRIDPKVDRDEQFAELRALRDDGLVRHVGLSEVTVEEIEAARRHVEIATVQNRYNLVDRASEDVLAYCEREGIGFIPWYPLAAGDLARPGGVAAEIAAAHGATPGQVALAWLLARSPVMLPIPGTGSLAHLEENVAAAHLRLSAEELARLDAAGA